jgi:hypothetical protein
MRFRVKEVKDDIYRPFFYPQYRTFWGWRNIGEHEFVHSVFSHSKKLTEYEPYVYYLNEAEEIIEEFKKYLKDHESYVAIHEIKEKV